MVIALVYKDLTLDDFNGCRDVPIELTIDVTRNMDRELSIKGLRATIYNSGTHQVIEQDYELDPKDYWHQFSWLSETIHEDLDQVDEEYDDWLADTSHDALQEQALEDAFDDADFI